MLEFIVAWGAAIAIFITTGLLMEALNRTIQGKAGDPGFKGVWYVWKRFFLVVVGALLGLVTFLLDVESPTGSGIGHNLVDGVVAAFAAGQFYELIIGTVKARLKHQLAQAPEK